MKRTLSSLTPLLLLISIPALGAPEPAPTPQCPPLLVSPSSPAQSSAASDQTTSELPAPLAGVLWLACSQAQNQYCYDTYCAGDPDCVGCVGFCQGLTLLSCQCDY